MIDSHSHTSYSKHATGTVDELVRASIAAGVTILTITDHAPFPVDTDNRLLASELDRYFADIERARKIYQGQITILCGLELDYMPGTDAFNCGFHAIRPPSPRSSGQAFHGHLAI
ncbi:PHP domain-containing protein, partial [Pseudomonas aeruginosa]